ncbi:MAG: hypothetical protein IPG42_19810 [Betaproteobacteria bacterium]|jgi:hypothetical protein|nr:hypothetical protein [Betaproteobacteria bacterium]
MKKRVIAFFASISTIAAPAFAHEGHGLGGAHWHATDTLGFVAAGVAIAVAIYLGKGGK